MKTDEYDEFENDAQPEEPEQPKVVNRAPRQRREPAPEPAEPEIEKGLPKTAARMDEADDSDEITIEHKGIQLSVPANQGDWPLHAVDSLQQGLTALGLHVLLGEEQWSALLRAGATNRDATAVLDKIAKARGVGSSGKMIGLIALLEQRGDEIESDLHDKGVDLVDLYRGRLSLRKVAVLIAFLPPTSALAIATNGGQAPWSLTEYLLTDLWALQARQLAGRKAPDAHPWRAEITRRATASRTSSRRAALLRAEARRQNRNRPKVAGRAR
ncbi:tail assembly chaperone [Gordonia phage BBQValindra]|nr:tail assembly chaperone [Gordonia phage BBQValindra]